MFIKNGMSIKPDVAKKMACFLVTKALYSSFSCEPITTLDRINETAQCLAQLHAAMDTQIVSSCDDVTRKGHGKSVRSSFLQRSRHLVATTFQQERSHCLDRFQTHSR